MAGQGGGHLDHRVVVDHPGYQPPVFGLLGGEHPIGQNQIHGPAQADHPGQKERRGSVGNQAGLGVAHGELGRPPGDDQIASGDQGHAGAAGGAGDCSHQRCVHLGQASQGGVQVHRHGVNQAGQFVGPGGGEAGQIPTAAEEFAVGPQQHGAHRGVMSHRHGGFAQLGGKLGTHGVAAVGAVEGDGGQPIIQVEHDCFKGHRGDVRPDPGRALLSGWAGFRPRAGKVAR